MDFSSKPESKKNVTTPENLKHRQHNVKEEQYLFICSYNMIMDL